MALSRSRRYEAVNYWPGFVDALSTMLLVIIFLLSVFMLAQFFLSREVTGKDEALVKLNRQIEELTNLLALERTQKGADEIQDFDPDRDARQRRAGAEAAQGRGLAGRGRRRRRQRQGFGRLRCARPGKADLGPGAGPGRRAQPADRRAAPATRGDRGRALRLGVGQQGIAVEDRRPWPTAQRRAGAESPGAQSLPLRLFGRLRQILGARPDIRVVGDRFVFESSVPFDVGKADISPAGKQSLDSLAAAVLDLEREIPPDIPWILRVDGHTDNRPVGAGGQYKSNWELSAARAVSVVQYLINKGVEADRLAAAGFGEFQPLDQGTDDELLARNRRIELKLTERRAPRPAPCATSPRRICRH